MKKGTLRNYLLSIVILFLCMNRAMAHPEQIGTCFIPKDPGKPQNGGKNVNFFVYKNHIFSTFGIITQPPLIYNQKIQMIQGDNWQIELVDKGKNLWYVYSKQQDIKVTDVKCKIKIITVSDAESHRISMEAYNSLVVPELGTDAGKRNYLTFNTYTCEPIDDEDDSKTPAQGDNVNLITGKKQSCCNKTLKMCTLL